MAVVHIEFRGTRIRIACNNLDTEIIVTQHDGSGLPVLWPRIAPWRDQDADALKAVREQAEAESDIDFDQECEPIEGPPEPTRLEDS